MVGNPPSQVGWAGHLLKRNAAHLAFKATSGILQRTALQPIEFSVRYFYSASISSSLCACHNLGMCNTRVECTQCVQHC